MAGRNFIIILLISVGVIQCLGDKVVETNVGNFRGAAASDGNYFEFLGVPYGQVNEANPFGVAAPYPAISGTYDANDDSIKCPQLNGGNIFGSLDCLRLNVYVPNHATAESQLPVMVFIHGGSFNNGHADKETYGPRFLMRHGVILVTITYRTGSYGFMCLNRRAVPGNQGLKDQVLAFKWIKNNIEAFGGNPNQVTLFGYSSGAHSVDLHLLSEQEQLYSKIIMHSGSSLAATVIYEPDRDAPIKLASYLELEHHNISVALKSLANAAPADVIRAATQLNIEFKPCAETKFDGVDAFITNYWIKSPVPKAQGLPILIGFTEYEEMMAHINKNNEHFQTLSHLFYNYLNQTFNFDEERIKRMEDYARRFYLGDDAIDQDAIWPIINFQSDYLYIHPIQRSIRKFIDSGAANIFYYMFSYSGGRNDASINNLDVQKASHGDDVRYLFDTPGAPAQISAQDQVTIDRMTLMWTNFAKLSNPTPEVTSLLPVQWVPIETNPTGDIYHYLRIDSELTMERRPFNRRMAFWDLFYKLNYDHQRSFEAAIAADDDDDDEPGNGNNSSIKSASFINIIIAFVIVAIYRQ